MTIMRLGVLALALSSAVGIAHLRGAGVPSRLEQPGRQGSEPSCDLLAAHPGDGAKPAGVQGVADGSLNAMAIDACAAAVQKDPASGRLKFQLGRALWAAEYHEEALEAFLQASDLGHKPALFYLGLASQKGIPDVLPSDPSAAHDLWVLAAADGFAPAVEALGSSRRTGDVAFSEFEQPELMRALHATPDATSALAPEARRRLMFYIAGLQNFVALSPNDYVKDCDTVGEPAMSGHLQLFAESEIPGLAGLVRLSKAKTFRDAAEGFTQQMKEMDRLAIEQKPVESLFPKDLDAMVKLVQAGTNDAYLLAADYGGCTGADFSKVYLAALRTATPVAPAKVPSANPYSPEAQLKARITAAAVWYERAGVPPHVSSALIGAVQQSAHLYRFPFSPRQRVAAWVEPGGSPGPHFTYPGTDPRKLPPALGIDPAKSEEQIFELTQFQEDVIILVVSPAVKEPGAAAKAVVVITFPPGYERLLRRVN